MPFVAGVLAGLLSTSSCWDIYDAAMRRAAQAVQPRFVSYDEKIWVRAYGQDVVRERTHVDYRDDGVAVVHDPRYGDKPVIMTHLEPGPPVLGPYGNSKARWQIQASDIRTIADVRVEGGERCENAGVVPIDGAPAVHLIFHRTDESHPGLKQLWIDAQSADIVRLVVAGAVRYLGTDSTQLADFDVRVTKVDGYSVVSHVSWWRGLFIGDYAFSNFAFPPSITALSGR